MFPLSFVLSGRRVANHVLVFSICTLSKIRVVFVCKAFFALYAVMAFLCFYVTFGNNAAEGENKIKYASSYPMN